MGTTITTLWDIQAIISDNGIDPDYYREDYVEIVSELYMSYILDHGFQWGGDIEDVDVPEDVYWGFFAEAELPDEDSELDDEKNV